MCPVMHRFDHEYVLLRSLLHSYEIEKGERRKQREAQKMINNTNKYT